jgi:hypothetical protein
MATRKIHIKIPPVVQTKDINGVVMDWRGLGLMAAAGIFTFATTSKLVLILTQPPIEKARKVLPRSRPCFNLIH